MPSSDFVRRLPSLMQPGLVITIDGFIPPHAKRFSINLSTTQNYLGGDIALHANPRFDENNLLVRNSYEKGKWMVEERIGSTLSLQRNANLKCTITGFSDKFQVNFNGQKYEFRHRIPQDRVKWLIVCGDVQVRIVNFDSSQVAVPPQICETKAPIDSPKASVSSTYIASSTVNGKTGSSDFVRRLPSPMRPGFVITIDGFIPSHAARFAVNLSTTCFLPEGDRTLHANPRFDEGNVLVRNSMERGKWMVEERGGPPLTLQKNANFKCTITGLSDKFQLDFNGQKYEFRHRIPQDRANWLIVYGDVQVRAVNFDSSQVAVPAQICETKAPIDSPKTSASSTYIASSTANGKTGSSDFVRRLPSPMRPGFVITIDGFIPPHAARFSVNLSTTCNLIGGDRALHANPRFDEGNVLVCNSFESGSWMAEERGGPALTLQKNANFKCTITGHSEKFQLDFNGQKYEFRHRIPQDRANWLVVYGDVQVRNVNFDSSQVADPAQICETKAPINSPKASVSSTYIASSTVNGKTGSSDFVRRLPGTMQPGLVITIDGFIPPHAKGFSINLSTTPNYLGGDIALHANPRFDENNVLVRNSYEKGKWMVEERVGSILSLQKNANFKCTITGLYIKFQVDFNGQKYEFSHRFPQDRVNWVILNGDVQVRNVDFSYQPRV